jgi:phage baseplate assembly protein W
MSRADRVTPKQPEVYSDFLSNLDLHPLSNDIAKVTNGESIKQSIRNLILTNFGERLFSPTVGSNVYKTLFENLDPFTLQNLQTYVEDTVTYQEPRARLLGVNVYGNEAENSVTITIAFSIINTGQTENLNLILKRVR